MIAAFGVWPALPLTGYWAFARNYRPAGISPLPLATTFALITVAGIAVWSVLLLPAAVAGVYRAGVIGLVGWAVTLFTLAWLLNWRTMLPEVRLELSAWGWNWQQDWV